MSGTNRSTLAEILGVLLVHAARKQRLNVFVETSGRDIAMYKYIDEFFPVRGPRHLFRS